MPVGMEAAMAGYTVRRGDTLSSIARRFGTTSLAIQQVNGMAGSTIRAGQELKLPQGDGERAGVQQADAQELAVDATYRVRPGDSLWQIARRHGTSASTIQRVNHLRSSRIKPGQVLKIPTTR